VTEGGHHLLWRSALASDFKEGAGSATIGLE